MTGVLRIAVVLAVAAAATIVANVVLLGVAAGWHDPVGMLSPPAAASSARLKAPTQRSPVPVSPGHEREHRDD